MNSSEALQLVTRSETELSHGAAIADGPCPVELSGGTQPIAAADNDVENFRLALQEVALVSLVNRGMQDLRRGDVFPFDPNDSLESNGKDKC